ncbi:MAG: AMP-binding protein, partial [Alphaproteobacteria bacterium]|nr:AMP-binding protein [Alphaproteobacteria bacterium]
PEDGELHTPYGATEALPVSTIAGSEVLAETRALTERGAGTCVGRPAPEVELRLIAVDDAPLASMRDAMPVAPGELGEVCVRGPVVTRSYAEEPEHTARAKLADEAGFWHRMGDLGRLDDAGRLWFCGRKAHRLETSGGLVASGPTEGVFDADARVRRSALVGVGARGAERPVLV